MVGDRRFDGRTALVTGAGSGFGRATAVALAREGAATVALLERYEDRLAAVCDEVERLGARALPLAVDLRNAGDARHAVARALDEAGPLDILISNHAVLVKPVPFLDSTDEDWALEMEVNLSSHYVIAREVARAMRDSGRGGTIAFTASVNALGASRGCAAYCATKAGLVALMQVMAIELAPHGIRVNCVSPGPADTQRSVDLVGEATMRRLRASFPAAPLNRLATADDVAQAFLYLASDAAAYVTGHNLVVDGGLSAMLYEVPDAGRTDASDA